MDTSVSGLPRGTFQKIRCAEARGAWGPHSSAPHDPEPPSSPPEVNPPEAASQQRRDSVGGPPACPRGRLVSLETPPDHHCEGPVPATLAPTRELPGTELRPLAGRRGCGGGGSPRKSGPKLLGPNPRGPRGLDGPHPSVMARVDPSAPLVRLQFAVHVTQTCLSFPHLAVI